MSEKTYKPGNYPDLPPPPGTVGYMDGLDKIYFHP